MLARKLRAGNLLIIATLSPGKEMVHKPDKELLERLKGVYVSSRTDVVTVRPGQV